MSYQTIHISLPTQSYPVYVGHSLLNNTELFRRHIHGKQVMIVTEREIADLYLTSLEAALASYQCDVTYLPGGEAHKTLGSWQMIINALLAKQHERSTTLIALGGGIVGDVTGFAAACYLRGVNYLQVPTTLIAQVDSAIGGKTGLNHAAGKNLIGAFHQPQCVLADVTTLNTLPRREFIAGLAEIIKYGLIRDEGFFCWLEHNMPALINAEPKVLLEAIVTSVRTKGEFVAQDAHEQTGIRSLLNFGHTLGHALEAFMGYGSLLHGEAVAIGMNLAAQISLEGGGLSQSDYSRIKALLKASLLPLEPKSKINPEKLLAYLKHDKKVHEGRIKFVLLAAIGKAVLTDQVTLEDLKKIIPH